MLDTISKCRDPLRQLLVALHTWVTTTYPDTVVTGAKSLDKEGWIDYAIQDGQGLARVFAGARFRRDKPVGTTIVLAARPGNDAMEWVHKDMGNLRPLGFAFGVPRPFEKSISEDAMKYVCHLVSQARELVLRGD